ncbi:MAG: hypothetical protein ABIK10_05620 [candidate division WOR-3 bacterium]
MNYKEAVKEKIKEEGCKKLWEEIADAYEKGGEKEVKMMLSEKANEIINKFNDCLAKLGKKF